MVVVVVAVVVVTGAGEPVWASDTENAVSNAAAKLNRFRGVAIILCRVRMRQRLKQEADQRSSRGGHYAERGKRTAPSKPATSQALRTAEINCSTSLGSLAPDAISTPLATSTP